MNCSTVDPVISDPVIRDFFFVRNSYYDDKNDRTDRKPENIITLVTPPRRHNKSADANDIPHH